MLQIGSNRFFEAFNKCTGKQRQQKQREQNLEVLGDDQSKTKNKHLKRFEPKWSCEWILRTKLPIKPAIRIRNLDRKVTNDKQTNEQRNPIFRSFPTFCNLGTSSSIFPCLDRVNGLHKSSHLFSYKRRECWSRGGRGLFPFEKNGGRKRSKASWGSRIKAIPKEKPASCFSPCHLNAELSG